ncbi:transcription elongation factor [Aureimonas flava]|uniref:Transcription elongation factor n=1 Tax=Aureimonas flava TaxID=2320271 RepID=A0A3A1WPM9_9HYPH|nr:GreA/GreB family elongation factor [Aureimonas flava]RIY02695.1 transcription elongation factor [Aureimonas flava]
MSVTFVKEPNEDQVEALPERDLGTDPNFVTPRGLTLLEREIEAVTRAAERARAAGDKIALAMAHRDLRYWRARRATAQVVRPERDSDVVQFGHAVEVQRGAEPARTFRIVGIDEADPAAGLVSYLSPLARQLVGREEGETVRIAGAAARILAILPPVEA